MLRDRFGAKSPLALSPPLVAGVCHATPCTPCYTMLHHSTLCYTTSHATLPKSQVRIVHSIMVVGMMIILVVVSDKYYTGYC